MTDDLRGIVGGAILGGLGGLHLFDVELLQAMPPTRAADFATDFMFKMAGTLILGVIGGLAGLFSKDLYKWLKDKFKKNGKVS